MVRAGRAAGEEEDQFAHQDVHSEAGSVRMPFDLRAQFEIRRLQNLETIGGKIGR